MSKRNIVDFLEAKKTLVAIADANTRASVRDVLKEVGLKNDDITFTSTLKESLEIFKKLVPHFIITESKINGECSTTLFKEHLKSLPNRSETMVLTLGRKFPRPDKYRSLSCHVDFFIEKPFVRDYFLKALKETIKKKASLSDKEKQIYSKISPYFQQSFENIENQINELKQKSLLNQYYYFVSGKVLEKQNNLKDAEDYYKKGHEQFPDDYYCLRSLYETLIEQNKYRQAYPYQIKLLKKYPIGPNDIPNMTKVYVANEKFDEMMEFCDKYISYEKLEEIHDMNDQIVKENKTSDQTGEIHFSLTKTAICLLACGKFYAQKKDYKKASEVFTKAFYTVGELSNKVQIQVVTELIAIGDKKTARELIEQIEENKDENYLVARIFLQQDQLEPNRLLNEGLKLIQQGVKDPRVFDIVIKKSVTLEKRASFIEELIDDAIRVHPKMNSHFSRFTRLIK